VSAWHVDDGWESSPLARVRSVLGRLWPSSIMRAKKSMRGNRRRPEEPVEPRVRRVVAEQLAVDAEDLAPDVSLTEDLAADSLDLVELAIGLEEELGISVPERTIGELRTYGQLVAVAQAHTRQRRGKEAWAESERTPPFIWARILPPPSQQSGSLERAGWLTPYTAETIVDGALRAGAGARLDMGVLPSVGEPMMAKLRAEFAWLRRRHIAVHIRRDWSLAPLGVVG
jgi:acyl carrier protein